MSMRNFGFSRRHEPVGEVAGWILFLGIMVCPWMIAAGLALTVMLVAPSH